MTDTTINVHVTSDIGRLREVVLGPVKPFTLEDLVAEADDDPDAEGAEEAHAEFAARYSIEAPDPELAATQHAGLVEVLERRGVTIHWVEPADCSIQLYTRDMGVVVDDVYFRARPHSPVRQREQAGLAALESRMSKVRELDAGHIEGGDVLVTPDDVLVGLGENTDRDGLEALRRALAAEGIDRDVVPLEFAHVAVVHLDVHFTLAGPRVGLFNPKAFTAESRAILEARYDLVEVTEDEVRGLVVNTVALGPDELVLQSTADRVAAELDERGITPVPLDFSEITRFPGGLHCATLPLVRE